jgi:hypothetical protein
MVEELAARKIDRREREKDGRQKPPEHSPYFCASFMSM